MMQSCKSIENGEKDSLIRMIARQNLLILNMPIDFEEIRQQLKLCWKEKTRVSPALGNIQMIHAVFNSMNDVMLQKYNLKVAYSCLQQPSDDQNEYYMQGLYVFYQVLRKRDTACISISDQVKQFVNQNIGKNISLADAAKKISISPNYLCRIFKEETGETFSVYCMRVKMTRAGELLMDPGLRVNEVSMAVGYNSVDYFHKLFKCHYHCTPLEYRRGLRK